MILNLILIGGIVANLALFGLVLGLAIVHHRGIRRSLAAMQLRDTVAMEVNGARDSAINGQLPPIDRATIATLVKASVDPATLDVLQSEHGAGFDRWLATIIDDMARAK